MAAKPCFTVRFNPPTLPAERNDLKSCDEARIYAARELGMLALRLQQLSTELANDGERVEKLRRDGLVLHDGAQDVVEIIPPPRRPRLPGRRRRS